MHASPFKCGGSVEKLPVGVYLIRTNGSGTKVHICDGGTPSSTAGHYLLNDTDAVYIDSLQELYILNITGDPDIYVAPVKRKA